MLYKVLFAILVLVMVSGCSNGQLPTNAATAIDNTTKFSNETLPLSVAKLPTIDFSKVDSYEKYKIFGDNVNSFFKILNQQSDIFNVPELQVSKDAWEKVSKFVNEYSPLIDNYNDAILTARDYENSMTKENLNAFYKSAGLLGLETGVIVGTVFYTASYQIVGVAYRSLGLNTFAFKCGTCVSHILSTAHWQIRTIMVETSSQIVQNAHKLIGIINETFHKNEDLQEAMSKFDNFLKTTKDEIETSYNEAGGISGIANKTINYTQSKIKDTKDAYDEAGGIIGIGDRIGTWGQNQLNKVLS